MLSSEQNRSIDIINDDGNCFLRAVSKELFGEEKHHKCLHTILDEYIKLNQNFSTIHITWIRFHWGPLQQDADPWKVCYSSGNSCTIYISANTLITSLAR